MVELAAPYDFFSLALASVVLVIAFFAVGLVLRRCCLAERDSRGLSLRPIHALVFGSCAAALAGALVTARGTPDYSALTYAYLPKACQIAGEPRLWQSLPPGSPSRRAGSDEISLSREAVFMEGLGKFAEHDDYLRGLIGLTAIPVGILILVLTRYLFAAASQIRALYSVLPRAAVALALGSSSFVSLLASHHLLFTIVNTQLLLLGSGYAYCYAAFAGVYTDLFWMIVFSGTAALAGLVVLPEALRISYQQRGAEPSW